MFPELTGLLQQMVDHRQRVVRQVLGAPSAAMAALAAEGNMQGAVGFSALKQSIAALASHRDEPPSRPTWRQTLDGWARQSFWFRIFYEDLTPWGQDFARIRQQEEEQAMRAREAARTREGAAQRLERARQGALRTATTQDQDDRRFLSEVDQSLLDALRDRGYFPQAPRVTAGNLTPWGLSGPVAMSAPGGAGTINMVTDRMGDFHDHLPQTPEGRQAMFEDWSAGNVPANHHERVFERWHILLHEASHCDYANDPAPFSPTPGRLAPEAQEAMNRWIAGGLAPSPRQTHSLMNENQADAYAAMLLLEATGHDPRARQALMTDLERRKKEARAIDEAFLEAHAAGTLQPGEVVDSHLTVWTLERVLADTDAWRGQPPEVLRKMSLRYASDGLLDCLDPSRMSADGKPVGRLMVEHITDASPGLEGLTSRIRWMSWAQAAGSDPGQWLDQQDKDHPLYPVLAESWGKASPALRDLMAQPLGDPDPDSPVCTMGEGLSEWNPEACDRRDALFQSLNLPVDDDKDPQVQAALAARASDMAMLRQTLLAVPGVDAKPLSQAPGQAVQMPGLATWRATRARPAPTPAPAVPRLST